MVIDAAVIGAGDSAELRASVFAFRASSPARRDATVSPYCRLIAASGAGSWRRYDAGAPTRLASWPKRPMRRRDGLVILREPQRQALGVVARGLDADRRAFDGPRPAALGAPLHRRIEIGEREKPLVIGTREPFGRNAADARAAGRIDLVAAGSITAGVKNLLLMGNLRDMAGPRTLLAFQACRGLESALFSNYSRSER